MAHLLVALELMAMRSSHGPYARSLPALLGESQRQPGTDAQLVAGTFNHSGKGHQIILR
jgi:hypothetical protein